MFHALKVVFHGSKRPFGRVFVAPPKVRRKTNCGYVSTFAPRIAENLTHFSTIADLLATFVAYRTPTKKFLRAACASNFENGSFHPQKPAFSNHRDIWRRHISPRFEACRKQQRALPPYRLTLRFKHCPRPISASLAAPPHSANADAMTRRARFLRRNEQCNQNHLSLYTIIEP